MSDPAAVIEVAGELEAYGTPRADFRQLSDAQRRQLARHIVIARAQAVPPSAEQWDDPRFRRHIRRVRDRYLYLAGEHGLDFNEARTVWWHAVYANLAPAARSTVV